MPACSDSDKNLTGHHYFASSWAKTSDDMKYSNHNS